MTILQMLQTALDHHQAGRLPQAEQLYRAVLTNEPNNPDALHLLGVLANQTGHPQDACDLITKAIAQKPAAEFYFNLAGALNPLGQRDRAIDALRQSISLNPANPDAHANLGVLLHQSGQLDSAIVSLQQAVKLNPKNPHFHFNLANALSDNQQYDQALDEFNLCLQLNSQNAAALINQGNTLRLLGRMDEALANFRRAAELDPVNPLAGSNFLFALQFSYEDPALLLSEHRKWDQQYAAPFKPAFPPAIRTTHRRLRIGYLSPEFRRHCQSLFTLALFPHHNHEEFEIFCYSAISAPDAITARLQPCADTWRPITHLSDDALADQIRLDEIDILVDLTMHMANGRPLVFACKPAPVQVCWLAYPGTTGISTMDYRLTDPFLDPPGWETRYTEQSIYLPETFWCYEPHGMSLNANEILPNPNDLPALKNKHMTFGCLNDFSKLNSATLARWGRLMQAIPDSRLHLLAPQGRCRQWVLDQLHPLAIAPDRIEFINRQPRPAYLAEYHRIDLCLDTLPSNGHSTSLDAFWMGIPVLTRLGPTVTGRAGISQLTNLHLPDFAADSDDQFLALAQKWASDLSTLSKIRHTLRDRMIASPLMNAKRFASNMEAAFRHMQHSNSPQK